MVRGLTFSRIESLSSSSMLGIVVNKHVVGHGQLRSFYGNLRRDHDLKPPHVPRIPCILETVLIAFQEELEEVSIDDHGI